MNYWGGQLAALDRDCKLKKLKQDREAERRKKAAIGIQLHRTTRTPTPDELAAVARAWHSLGAERFCIRSKVNRTTVRMILRGIAVGEKSLQKAVGCARWWAIEKETIHG